MNSRPARGAGRPQDARLLDHLLVALGIAAVSAVVLRLVENQQAYLGFYDLPIAWGAWRLGRTRGVLSAIAAASLVFTSAAANESLFALRGVGAATRWLDLGIWAGFLLLTAYAVGTLAERDEHRLRQLRDAYRGVLEIMAKFIDSYDRSTENHSRRVAERAVEIARELQLDDDTIETIRVAAYLHDIGKVDVSADILQKAAALTPDEHEQMKRHVDHGTDMLWRVGGMLEHVIPLVRYHHERWDGRGYKGLSGEDIPLGARIIAVADTYDAIVADRPYRRGRTHEEALALLRAERGTQFDPNVIDAFLRLCEAAPGAESESAENRAAA